MFTASLMYESPKIFQKFKVNNEILCNSMFALNPVSLVFLFMLEVCLIVFIINKHFKIFLELS